MNKKEKFLKIASYEVFDKRREEFKGLTMKDPDVRKHMSDILGKGSNIKEELYSYLPDGTKIFGGKKEE